MEEHATMTGSDSQKLCQLPVVVGVTGHRFLSASTETAVRGSIARIFDELDGLSGGSIQVMSALAEGADRIFAEIALERGYKCIAPLPMSPDEYEKDFTDIHSRKAFRRLLEQCDWYIAAPLSTGNSHLQSRDLTYLAAGHAMTAESHVLIALWDGEEGLLGGTSDVVACTLDPSGWVEHMDVDRLANTNGCIVYHIKTPRADADQAGAGTIRRLIPMDWTTETCDKQAGSCGIEVEQGIIQKLLLPIAVFNTDSAKHAKLDLSELSVFSHAEFAIANEENADTGVASEAFVQASGFFLACDRLASYFQLMARRHVMLRLGLLVIGMGIFETYTGLLDPEWKWILGGLLLVGGAMAGWPRIKRDLDQRFVDYRVLCECTRVFLYLQMAGISDIHPAQYIRYQGRGLDWVKLALCVLQRQAKELRRAPSLEGIKHLQKKWLQSQIIYFENATLKEAKHQRRNMSISALMLVCAVVLVVAAMTQMHSSTSTAHTMVAISLLGTVSLLLLIGVIQTYSGYRAYREHVNRFTIMKNAYVAANRDMTIAIEQGDLARAERITRHIAVLSLQEVSDWLILHRERPPEISPV